MEDRDGTIGADLDGRTRAFELRFIRTITGGLTIAGLVALVTTMILQPTLLALVCLGTVATATGTSLALTYTSPDRRPAAAVFLVGVSLAAGLGLALDREGTLAAGAIQALLIVVVLAPFLLPRGAVVGVTLLEMAIVLAAHAKMVLVDGRPAAVAVPAFGTAIVLGVASASISVFVRHAAENQDTLRKRLRDIDVVMDRARRIAKGDLSGEVSGEGDVSQVIGAMLAGLRGLVEQIQTNATHLAQASNEIAAMAQQQEQSAIEQGGAIEETRRTVGTLLEGSRQIAGSARGVTENATATLHNAELITERIRVLSEHAQRITEVLELIRDVANKSELLALNAALEGAKAGEAGRGFSLVASQMQRLAESVMESVKVVKDLTADIRKATQATALATEDATKLASDTTEAARRIGVITQEQEGSTEQVTRAMDEIADATHQSAAGTNQTLQAVRELSQIASRLDQYASRFQL